MNARLPRVRWRRAVPGVREARCGPFALFMIDMGDPGFSPGELWAWRVEDNGREVTVGGGWSEDLVIEDGLRALARTIAMRSVVP